MYCVLARPQSFQPSLAPARRTIVSKLVVASGLLEQREVQLRRAVVALEEQAERLLAAQVEAAERAAVDAQARIDLESPCVPSGLIHSTDTGRSHEPPAPHGLRRCPCAPNRLSTVVTIDIVGSDSRAAFIWVRYAALFTTSGSIS